MPSIINTLTAVALFAVGIQAQKKAFWPDLNRLDQSSDRVPPASAAQTSKWAAGTYPSWCYDTARAQRGGGNTAVNCAINKLEVYTVTYADCPSRPWTMCRCSDSQISLNEYVLNFGRVPRGIRSRVVHTMTIADSGSSAGSSNDRILFRGALSPAVYMHESMHSADQGFSASSTFKTAYDQDTCVPDNYANASPAEDVAQLGVWISYDTNPQTKVSSYAGDFSCMGHQLEKLGQNSGEQINRATSYCFDRRPNDPNVSAAVKRDSDEIDVEAIETLPPVVWDFEDFF